MAAHVAEFPLPYSNQNSHTMPSFDIVLEPDLVEVKNAIDQSNKEIGTRFDFKGSDARIEQKDKELTLFADSDFQLQQVTDILLAKMSKRSVDARFLDSSAKPEKMSHDKLKQKVVVKAGIESELAKKIQKAIKESKMKVQASIQGDTVRVTGAKRDDLQAAMALIRKEDAPLSFNNFRD
ncbi:MAG: hypothetical protein RLY71_2173 [Pseudomonadota bacterium]|jgi:uncharacterized protein YajQ (UPF0234 family)